MKRKCKLLLPILIILVCGIVSYATAQATLLCTNQELIGLATTTATATNGVSAYNGILTVSGAPNTTLSFDSVKYSKLSYDEQRGFMELALGTVSKSSSGAVTKNKIYNFIESQDEALCSAIKYLKTDTAADFIEARKWFAPFSGPISTLIGFLCIIIFAFLGLSVAFDVCYLVIPAFQLLLERGEPEKRPVGVSKEAWGVNKEVEASVKKTGVMQMYMKRRIPVFFFASLILAWLISGKIYDFVIFFMDAFNA